MMLVTPLPLDPDRREIAARFDMAKPSISQHLSILENAELIEGEKKGQYIHYSLRPAALRHALMAMLTTTMAPDEEADVENGRGHTDAAEEVCQEEG